MSYDVGLYFEAQPGSPEPQIDGHNYTYNCGPMFRLALGGDGINDLKGMPAPEASKRLAIAIARMMEAPEHFREMNPPNGWGSYEGALMFLVKIKNDCDKWPAGIVYVC